jgi:two-component system nitrate/nitrite response regulator NarL
MIKVLIIEDHILFAEGLKAMFTKEDEIEIVAHIQNGKEAPDVLNQQEIDLILMDIDMPVIDGLETMTLLKKQGFNTPVLMLTMHQSLQKIKKSLENGAQGYVLKDASKKELLQAIQKTSKRENYFHSKINNQLFDYFRGKNKPQTNIDELTTREKEIVKCIADGMNSNEIAKSLFISQHTVKTHRRNIMYKVNVKTSAELIRLAIERKIIEP